MKRSLILACAALLGGCATYQPHPLPGKPDLAGMPTDRHGHAVHRLSLTQATTLAVRDNPDLRASRLKAGISSAALYRAGLLPDPQLSLGVDHPTDGGPGLFNAYNLGLAQNLKWLVTRNAKIKAARAADLKQGLDIDWQTWQLAAKVQQQYLTLWYDHRQLTLLRHQRALYHKQHQAARQALRQGDITLDTAAATLVSLTQTEAQIARLHRQVHQRRIRLNALMGLKPDVQWNLTRPQVPASPTSRQIDSALSHLAERRPDLLALQAGYRSSDARYRAAILGQFPSLNVGFTKARDTSNIHTIGLGITLNLPLFNGNRGQVAVTRATRNQLYAAYQARLDQATTDVRALQTRLTDDRRTLQQLQSQMPELHAVARHARQAFDSGNLAGASFIAIERNYLDRQRELIQLRQTLYAGRLSLRVLLGQIPTGKPQVAPRTPKTPPGAKDNPS